MWNVKSLFGQSYDRAATFSQRRPRVKKGCMRMQDMLFLHTVFATGYNLSLFKQQNQLIAPRCLVPRSPFYYFPKGAEALKDV